MQDVYSFQVHLGHQCWTGPWRRHYHIYLALILYPVRLEWSVWTDMVGNLLIHILLQHYYNSKQMEIHQNNLLHIEHR